jgi:ankyrin repeat protein
LVEVRDALKNGGEINSREHLLLNGDTALIMAAKRRNREMASFLIEQGADINATNYQGDTALIMAIRIIDPEMVKLLVEQGANINAEALWLADKSKNDEMFFLVNPDYKDILAIENNKETNDDEKFLPKIIKPRTHGLPYINDYEHDLFLRGPWIPMK